MKNLWRHLVTIAALVACTLSSAGTITYYHNDIAGSPIAATNESGAVLWRESYRPYGERLTNAPASTPNDVWFTSRRQDVDTGLVYMGARYYDPVIGRFMSTDPVGLDENNLHSFNRYAYANNNPYRYIDPDGQAAEDLFPNGAPIVAAGRSLGAVAAYLQGIATSNAALQTVAAAGAAEERQGNLDALLVLMSVGRSGGGRTSGAAAESSLLTAEQAANLARFESKIPANATETRIYELPGGGRAFQADSPGKVPGSFAQYEKQIDASGTTINYTKTTFGPKGEIFHVADKISNQKITP